MLIVSFGNSLSLSAFARAVIVFPANETTHVFPAEADMLTFERLVKFVRVPVQQRVRSLSVVAPLVCVNLCTNCRVVLTKAPPGVITRFPLIAAVVYGPTKGPLFPTGGAPDG